MGNESAKAQGAALTPEHERALTAHYEAAHGPLPEGIGIGDILKIGGKILNAAVGAAVTGEFDVPVKGVRLGPGGEWDLDVKGRRRP